MEALTGDDFQLQKAWKIFHSHEHRSTMPTKIHFMISSKKVKSFLNIKYLSRVFFWKNMSFKFCYQNRLFSRKVLEQRKYLL